MYPKCMTTFKQWYKSHPKYEQNYVLLGKPTPFDVSLRDGIQTIQPTNIGTIDKLKIYNEIKQLHNPTNMEIGSLASTKLFPIFSDSVTFFNYLDYKLEETNKYIVVPNEAKLKENLDKFINLRHISLIASASNSFQLKNTKMSLDETFKQITNIKDFLNYKIGENNYSIKMYISCINECPIDGKLDTKKIVDNILLFNSLNPNILCLSDTCGTLTSVEFEEILTQLITRIQLNNVSLHLHVKNESEVEKIMFCALDYGINKFDVSMIEFGGCSMTLDKKRLCPNLSYELYYKFLMKYIIKKSLTSS